MYDYFNRFLSSRGPHYLHESRPNPIAVYF
jgi:hypothetical protein